MVICLERGADLHMDKRIRLPLTVCSFSKIQIGFTFLVPAHLGTTVLDKGPLNARARVCVCVYDNIKHAALQVWYKISVSANSLQLLPASDKINSKTLCRSKCVGGRQCSTAVQSACVKVLSLRLALLHDK